MLNEDAKKIKDDLVLFINRILNNEIGINADHIESIESSIKILEKESFINDEAVLVLLYKQIKDINPYVLDKKSVSSLKRIKSILNRLKF